MAPNHPCTKSYITLIIGIFVSQFTGLVHGQSAITQLVNPFGTEVNIPDLLGYFSVGEAAISTIDGPGGIITQGFLQPEINQPCSDFLLDFFPNPVSDKITIRDTECGKIIESIKLYDTYGKWVATYRLINRQADLTSFVPGVYLVRAYGTTNEFLGAFKIVKMGSGKNG